MARFARIQSADLFVSAASIREINIKRSLGKLQADPREVLAAVAPAGCALLAVTGEHAANAVPGGHGAFVTVVSH